MVFESIHIQNFLSIRDVHLNLNNQGLVLLHGKNLDNSSLNSNGAGKSAILEAIIYALYGKTLRGLKGDAVVHQQVGKNTSVKLNLVDDDGTTYQIARYRKDTTNKNKSLLYRNSQDITPKSEADFDSYITNLLQADYNTFTASLLYSAESFKFATATDGEIKKTFDTMLGLEILSTALELTRSQLKSVSKTLLLYKNKTTLYTDQLLKLKDKEQNLQNLQKKFDEDKSIKLAQLQQSIVVLQTKFHALSSEMESLQLQLNKTEIDWETATLQLKNKTIKLQQVDKLKDELHKIELEHDNIMLKIKTHEKAIAANNQEITRLQNSILNINGKIDRIKEKKQNLIQTIGQPCPTCGAPITSDRIADAKQHYDNEIQELQTDILSIQHSITEIQTDSTSQATHQSTLSDKLAKLMDTKQEFQKLLKRCKHMETSRDELVEQVDKLKEQCLYLKSQLQLKSLEIQQNDELISQTQKNLESSKQTSNPYDELVAGIQSEIDSITTQQQEVLVEVAAKEKQEQHLKFWEIAFSNQGIKSYILDDITPFLNRRINRYLTKLAAGQIEAIFSTRTTLKSGDESERFSLTITNQNGGENYVANSSGEKKRIDLAINLALQDLVASRSSKKINVAIFDEVFDALDENGIDNVVALLQELSQEKSTILVVTHNEHLKSYFNNCITVVKENGFTSIAEC